MTDEPKPTKKYGRRREPFSTWVRQKVRLDHRTGCWVWMGSKNGGGYGQTTLNGKHVDAHRLVYSELVGDIPSAMDLDHLCRNRACVNPDHLEPVSRRTNLLRGYGVSARNAIRTHCNYGHAFSGDNLGVDGHGYRYCRQCKREQASHRYHRKMEMSA